MKIYLYRTSSVIALFAFVLSFFGCGGGAGNKPRINDRLFVPNYVSSLDGLYCWDHLPMKAVFYLPSNWQELYPSDHSLYVEAVNQWNQEGKQTLIVIVPPGQSSDCAVTFVPQAELGGTTRGRTEAVHDYNGVMKSATIKIALDTPWGVVLPGVARTIIAHELGHALGINGHSPYAEDLMYATQLANEVKEATIRDLNTVMTAYPSYFATASVRVITSGCGHSPTMFVID